MPPMMAALLLRRHLQLVRLGLQLMLLIVLRMWYDRPVHMVSRVIVAGTREVLRLLSCGTNMSLYNVYR